MSIFELEITQLDLEALNAAILSYRHIKKLESQTIAYQFLNMIESIPEEHKDYVWKIWKRLITSLIKEQSANPKC